MKGYQCSLCSLVFMPGADAEMIDHRIGHAVDGEDFILKPVYPRPGLTPKGIAWYWPGRLALGKLTLLDGDPDVGKSLIGLDNALRVVRGSNDWPEGRSNFDPEPAPALIFTREDNWDDTILPRLLAAQATREEIGMIYHNPVDFDIPERMDVLFECIRDLGARYVVLDPLEAYVSMKYDTNKSKDTRQALDPFAEAIQESMAAFWAVRHTNKRENAKALDKGSGSRQLGAVARINLMAGKNPNDPNYSVLAKVKSNLAGKVAGLSYLTPTRKIEVIDPLTGLARLDEFPFIRWDGMTTVTADQVVAGPNKPKVAQECAALIEDILSEYDHLIPSEQLESIILMAGYTENAYRDARKVLGFKIVNEQKEDGKWYVGLRDAA